MAPDGRPVTKGRTQPCSIPLMVSRWTRWMLDRVWSPTNICSAKGPNLPLVVSQTGCPGEFATRAWGKRTLGSWRFAMSSSLRLSSVLEFSPLRSMRPHGLP